MNYFPKHRDFYLQTIEFIQANPDPQILLATMAQKLGELFDAHFCLVAIKDHRLQGYWHRNNTVQPKFTIENFKFGLCPGIISEFTTGEQQEGVKISLSCQDNVEGLVVINRELKWSKSDKQFLKKITESLTIGLNFAYLKYRLETTFRYQSLFEDIGNKMRQITDVNSILNLTLEDTAQALGVERGLIMMLKYKNPFWNNLNSQEIPEANVEIICQWFANQQTNNYPKPLASFLLKDSPLCCKALEDVPQLLAIPDRNELGKITQQEPPIFQLDSVAATLIIPLIGNSRQGNKPLVLGFSILINSQNHFWQSDEIQLAKWVAIQASTSIVHNQTLQRVQSLVEERTAQLKTSLDFQAKLSEKMRHHIEELQRLNTVKDDFIATLSDELKHPLTKIKIGIEMLKIASSIEQRDRYLKIIETECAKEINLVNDLLTLQQLESKQFKITPTPVNLEQILEDLTRAYQEEWKDKGLTFTVNSGNYKPVILYIDTESLERILRELLKNAGKFSQKNTTIFVTITPNEHKITIAVTNTGDWISTEEQGSIFDTFRRGKDVTKGSNQGTGLGLALVKSLVQYLSGTITVSSHPEANSNHYLNCFTITFPRA